MDKKLFEENSEFEADAQIKELLKNIDNITSTVDIYEKIVEEKLV